MNCSDGPVVRTGTAAPIEAALVPQAARTPDPSRPFLPFRAQKKVAEVCLDQSVLTTENTEFAEKNEFVILSDSEESEVTKTGSFAFAQDDKERISVSSVRSVFKNLRDGEPARCGNPTPCPSRQFPNESAPETTNGVFVFPLPLGVIPAFAGMTSLSR
jgi:hypothetical protein